ncbi:MAG: ABC transporter permease [Rikenellaceae bacterium]
MIEKFEELGRYTMLMGKVFSHPVKRKIFFKQLVDEMDKLGLNSVAIVIIISFFIGTVVVIQMAINLENPFIPKYLIGYATRETLILEFSSTIVALILSGKIGSNIASEIGSMRITEQIDALEIMGINSASYLILPKIVAALFFFPFLTLLSMFCGVIGGYIIVFSLNSITPSQYVMGLGSFFKTYSVIYGVTKAFVFGFIVTSVASFYGYYAKGSSLEVGRSSTKAVVTSIIAVLIFNLILTKMFFSY